MADTKLGIDQMGKPAPLWYRRLSNAIILCFLPMAVGLVQGIPMSDPARNIWMVVCAAIPFGVKGFGMILGNGQIYSPSNSVIDSQSDKS